MRLWTGAGCALVLMIGVAGMAGTAAAADFSEAGPNWTGFYLGLNGGYGWGFGDDTYGGTGRSAPSVNPSGWLAGGQIGWNWQFAGNALFGVEGSLDATGMTGTGTDVFDPGNNPPSTDTYSDKQSISTLGMFRARMGLAAGAFVPYVIGGAAFAKSTREVIQVSPSGPTVSDTKSYTGWTIGGGAEVALGPHWSVRGEYDYVDLGTQNFSVPSASGGYDVHLTASLVTGAVNFRW